MSTRARLIRSAVRFIFWTASAGAYLWFCYAVLSKFVG